MSLLTATDGRRHESRYTLTRNFGSEPVIAL